MAGITKVDPTSLKIEVNRSPISYIELPSTLEKLTVTLTIDQSLKPNQQNPATWRIMDIIHPPKQQQPHVGQLYGFYNQSVVVTECCNIQKSLQKFEPHKDPYYEELRDQGFVHTVQVPVKALHAAGFLTDEQVKTISSFVQRYIVDAS